MVEVVVLMVDIPTIIPTLENLEWTKWPLWGLATHYIIAYRVLHNLLDLNNVF